MELQEICWPLERFVKSFHAVTFAVKLPRCDIVKLATPDPRHIPAYETCPRLNRSRSMLTIEQAIA